MKLKAIVKTKELIEEGNEEKETDIRVKVSESVVDDFSKLKGLLEDVEMYSADMGDGVSQAKVLVVYDVDTGKPYPNSSEFY